MALNYQSEGFSDALVILGAAGLVIPAFARFRISPVIGFILVGMLVGPFGLGSLVPRYPWLQWVTISDKAALETLGELGIIFMLFSIGLELSYARLWAMRKQVFGFGPVEMLGSGALIAGALWLFGSAPAPAIGLGLALAMSSTALVMSMVSPSSAVGRLALAMLLFEDMALVPIVFLLGVVAPDRTGSEVSGLVEIALTGGAVVVAMLVLGRFLIPPVFAQAARTKSPEIFMATTLVIAILASVATAIAGLSPIVGALVAGLLIAETSYRNEVESVTRPFRGLGIGVFLIAVGMSLDLAMIVRDWLEIIGAVVGVVVIKTIVTAALLRLGGVSRGLSAEVGILMASPSELTLIVLATALQAGIVAADTAAFWQVVTAVGLTITPLLARIGHDVARRIEWRESPKPPDKGEAAHRTILIGYGRVGQMVAEMLETHQRPFLAIEADIDIVSAARRMDKPVRYGDASRTAILDSLHLETATAVVLTMDDPVQAVHMTRIIRTRFPDLTIVARARDAEHAAALYRAGATDAVPETLESSLQLSEAVLVDLGVAMGPVIASIHEKRDELREQIRESGNLEHAPRLGSLRSRV
jgi:CPA2 family monovalent cation:H+ antiporter-2